MVTRADNLITRDVNLSYLHKVRRFIQFLTCSVTPDQCEFCARVRETQQSSEANASLTFACLRWLRDWLTLQPIVYNSICTTFFFQVHTYRAQSGAQVFTSRVHHWQRVNRRVWGEGHLGSNLIVWYEIECNNTIFCLNHYISRCLRY